MLKGCSVVLVSGAENFSTSCDQLVSVGERKVINVDTKSLPCDPLAE